MSLILPPSSRGASCPNFCRSPRQNGAVKESFSSAKTTPDAFVPLSCATDASLDADTRVLVHRSLVHLLGQSKPGWSESPAETTMKRVVTQLLDKHRYSFKGTIQKMLMEKLGSGTGFMKEVAVSMFSDGRTNWGRVVSLMAFGATACQCLQEQEQQDCVSEVASEISSYLLEEQRDWLLQNNSWDGFVEFFREADPESAVRSALMAVVGVAAVGMCLAKFLR